MKVHLVWSWSNDWAGHLNGEASKECTLFYVASSRLSALTWMEKNRAVISHPSEPPAHWVLEEWPLDVDTWSTTDSSYPKLEHFTADMQPCNTYGRVEEVADELDTDTDDDWEEEDEDLLDVEDDSDDEPTLYDESPEQAIKDMDERPRGHFLVRHEEGKLPSVDLDEIEQAYVEQAEDEAMERFSGFANRIADRMNELADLALDICEELRDEFPSK